jgi:hypothetical protein
MMRATTASPPPLLNPLPPHTHAQVRREERDIIGELPPKLRAGVLHHLYADTLERVPAFRGQHPAFLADLVECLRAEYYVAGGWGAGGRVGGVGGSREGRSPCREAPAGQPTQPLSIQTCT